MERLPERLQRPPASHPSTRALKVLLRKANLVTVCEEARCPNIVECFSRRTATFMILGDICTRGCRFCSVKTGRPEFSADKFENEAQSVATAARKLGLRHVVVTSVARDDLSDGGAEGFCKTIAALKELPDSPTVEVLVPDFRGNRGAIEAVIDAGPDVFNHNLETISRLYRRVRPGTSYQRSLGVLRLAKQEANRRAMEMITKTGIMLGFGETSEEVYRLMQDCRKSEIDSFTAGQYLQPSRTHLPVSEYVSDDVFKCYETHARKLGFRYCAIGPLVRSSYHAESYVN